MFASVTVSLRSALDTGRRLPERFMIITTAVLECDARPEASAAPRTAGESRTTPLAIGIGLLEQVAHDRRRGDVAGPRKRRSGRQEIEAAERGKRVRRLPEVQPVT